VLLHPTSLPGGRLGTEAYEFVDWLAAAGQSWWQVLPLGPPDPFGSPYTSPSAFAGSPALLAEPQAEVTERELADFRDRHAYWIGAWESFARAPDAVADQVRFEREWLALRSYAASRGIRIVGDMPIYVAQRGAAVAAHGHFFLPGLVAGAAPDAAHPEGQLWGMPVYDWRELRSEGYRWWIERFRHALHLFDLVRIDHFRGFVAFWVIPEGAASPLEGRWHRGPGIGLFRAVEAELGTLPLVAEDLGLITPAVDRLRERIDALSMRIIGRSFMARHRRRQAVAVHPENAVVYTGTHDHPTIAGWWKVAPADERERALEDLAASGIDPDGDIPWAVVRLTLSSRARLAILPAQDLLGLGNEARMNTPGTVSPQNWTWRLLPGQLTLELAERLRAATVESERLGLAAAQASLRERPRDAVGQPADAEPAAEDDREDHQRDDHEGDHGQRDQQPLVHEAKG
jgi:4-alpha-glucanotransferase